MTFLLVKESKRGKGLFYVTDDLERRCLIVVAMRLDKRTGQRQVEGRKAEIKTGARTSTPTLHK